MPQYIASVLRCLQKKSKYISSRILDIATTHFNIVHKVNLMYEESAGVMRKKISVESFISAVDF
jgi:hypothetical protein